MKDVWSADVGTGDAQLREIDDLIQKHEDWRSGCLNMIASENLVSPAVRCYALGDLYQRYGCYFDNDPADREYRGNRYIASLEIAVQRMAREVFEAQFADLWPQLFGDGALRLPGAGVGREKRREKRLFRSNLISLPPRQESQIPFPPTSFPPRQRPKY